MGFSEQISQVLRSGVCFVGVTPLLFFAFAVVLFVPQLSWLVWRNILIQITILELGPRL
jgi:hypothetical protein